MLNEYPEHLLNFVSCKELVGRGEGGAYLKEGAKSSLYNIKLHNFI